MTMRSSEVLIERVAQGDRNALRELYDRHASIVRTAALGILREAEHADEVVQMVFVEAWRDAARYEARQGQPAAWLATLARRRALGHLLRHARVPAPAHQALDGPYSS